MAWRFYTPSGPISPPPLGLSVTSAELSVTAAAVSAQAASAVASEISNRLSADAVLSASITVVSNAASQALSVANQASDAASIADDHASTASLAATSVDSRVNSLNTFLSGISAVSVGGISTHGLQSVINALSNRISASGGTASVTSAELSTVAAGLSGRIDSVEVHASTASAAATSVDSRVNSINTFISGISSRSVGDISTHGLQSVINAISNRLSASIQTLSAAVTSVDAHAAAASAAATSVDARLSTLSDKVVSISAQLVSLEVHASAASAAATSADGHANTVSGRVVSVSAELASLVQIASAAASSVDGRVTSVNAALSALSARSVGDVSTHGLQSVINALSNRISAVVGGTASVTSNELSAAAATLSSRITSVVTSATLGNVLMTSVLDFLEIATPASAPSDTARLWAEDINGVTRLRMRTASGQPLTLTQDSLLVVKNNQGSTINKGQVVYISGASGANPLVKLAKADAFATATGTAIVHDVSIADNAFGLVTFGGLVENFDTSGFLDGDELFLDASTAGALTATPPTNPNFVVFVGTVLQSHAVNGVILVALDMLTDPNLVSVAAALSLQVSAISSRITSISAQLVSLETHASAASAAATSVAAVGVSNNASLHTSITAEIASVSAIIKADIASVSAAIRADEASHIASTSATIKTDINSVSAAIIADVASHLTSLHTSITAEIASVSAVIKADIASVSAAILDNLSVQMGAGQFHRVTGAQAIATATFTKVSGLSLSLGGSNFYEVHGQLIWSQSGAGSASAIFNFGMSATQQPVMAMFKMTGNTGALIAAGGLSSFTQFGGNSAICATPSIMYSAKPNPGVSGSVANTMFFDGVIQCSTAAGTLEVVVATSTAAFGINIAAGSYIKAFRIG